MQGLYWNYCSVFVYCKILRRITETPDKPYKIKIHVQGIHHYIQSIATLVKEPKLFYEANSTSDQLQH